MGNKQPQQTEPIARSDVLLQNSEEDVASSLLGTPQLATQASHPRVPMTTPRRLATAPPQQDEQQVIYRLCPPVTFAGQISAKCLMYCAPVKYLCI